MPRETVDAAALIKVADDAQRLSDEELFKLLAVLLIEWLGRRGMPFPQSEPYVEHLFREMLTDVGHYDTQAK